MPSLDLFNAAADPDGSHDVRAPGGYEWWYFDAEDPATDTQIVAIFMHGFVFHPGYLRAYKRYLRRPTRTLPPVPGDWPSVYLCVYRGGRVWKQFFTEYRREDCAAASDRCGVRIGPDNSARAINGGYGLRLIGTPWQLTGRGPVTLAGQTLAATFTFRPRDLRPALERTFLSSAMTNAEHRWAIVAPACDVSGSIELTSESGKGSETIGFAGRGYHDHNFGTAPIGDGLARWTWGRAMFESGRVVTFHHAEPRDRTASPETHLIEATPAAVVEHAPSHVVLGRAITCKPAMLLRYPSTIDFGDALRLSEPRVLDPSPFYLRLQYTAESFGERSTAFCELAYPHRVRWPILGRMIEMSFDKRPRKAAAAGAVSPA